MFLNYIIRHTKVKIASTHTHTHTHTRTHTRTRVCGFNVKTGVKIVYTGI